jgi:hypothetical protein
MKNTYTSVLQCFLKHNSISADKYYNIPKTEWIIKEKNNINKK